MKSLGLGSGCRHGLDVFGEAVLDSASGIERRRLKEAFLFGVEGTLKKGDAADGRNWAGVLVLGKRKKGLLSDKQAYWARKSPVPSEIFRLKSDRGQKPHLPMAYHGVRRR